MIQIETHRRWLNLLALAAALFVSYFVLSSLQHDAQITLASLHADNLRLQQEQNQLASDIRATTDAAGHMDAQRAEKILAPTRRVQAATRLEQYAKQNHLDHFAYTITPEQKIHMSSVGGMQNLASSIITMSGTAPLDTNIYAYLDHIQDMLPGHVRLQQMSLEQTGNNSSDANTERMINFNATLEWISNGADTQKGNSP